MTTPAPDSNRAVSQSALVPNNGGPDPAGKDRVAAAMQGDDEPLIVGIDLGTTNSLVAWSDAAGPRILPVGALSAAGGLVPSVVHYGQDGRVTVGTVARSQAIREPERTVYSVKRLMGLGPAQAAGLVGRLGYRVVDEAGVLIGVGGEAGGEDEGGGSARGESKADGLVYAEIDGRRYSPQEVSAELLRALQEAASEHFGRPVRKAVVTVPAYFNDSQRQATRDAGRIAGLEVVRIVSEPTAAALAYGLAERQAAALAVGAPGGAEGLAETGEAAGGSGRVSLGLAKAGVCPSSAVRSGEAGGGAAHGPERGSEGGGGGGGLSRAKAYAGQDRLVAVYDLGGGTFDVSILALHAGVFEVRSTAGDTALGGDDFDQLLMGLFEEGIYTGVGRRFPFPAGVRQELRELAERCKHELSRETRVWAEVSVGPWEGFEQSYRYQRELTRAEFERLITPLVDRTMDLCRRALADAGARVTEGARGDLVGEVVLVGGSTRVPLVKRRVGELFGCDPYDAINPDEVVALGAAVQASILAGVRRDVVLLDVLPLSLGMESMGGAMAKLIMRNTPIPCEAEEIFSTYVDGQTRVLIHVLQGERELAADCRSLARIELTGLAPMPAGLPKIRVRFAVDANGILSVSAVEERSGARAEVQVLPSHGLTPGEVDRLESEAIARAEEDFRAHHLIDLRLHARRDLTACERNLRTAGQELSEPERLELASLMAGVEGALASTDPDVLRLARDRLLESPATIRLAERALSSALRGV